MAAPRPQIHLMATADEVEAQFYEALREGDIHKLMALWADDDDIVCVHPGGQRSIGARAIRAGFEAIFQRGGIPVQPGGARRSGTLDWAVHNLIETVAIDTGQGTQSGYVVATNVYVKTALGWRIVAHHASPGVAAEPGDPAEGPATLH